MMRHSENCIFGNLVLTFLCVISVLIITNNDAHSEEKYTVKEFKCFAPLRFSLDLGVDPICTTGSTTMWLTPTIANCDGYSSSVVGCMFVADLTSGEQLIRGTYILKNDAGETIKYSILSNFVYNKKIWPLPSRNENPDYSNTGYPITQNGLPLDFGTQQNLKREVKATSSIVVGCNRPVDSPLAFSIKFCDGQNYLNGQRRMKSENNYIGYDLSFYSNNGQQFPVGSTPGKIFYGSGNGSGDVLGIEYPREEEVAAGIYTDTMILTMEY